MGANKIERTRIDTIKVIKMGYGHTKLSFFLSILTILMMGWIWNYFKDDDWSIFPLLELGFAISGYFVVAWSAKQGILMPEVWAPWDWKYFGYAMIMWVANMLIQIIVGLTFSIGGMYRAFYVLFAAIAETLFFQGVLTNLLNKLVPSAISITVSAFVFMVMHVNYYNMPGVMLSVFLAGCIYSYTYNKTNSVTVPMLGHLFLNAVTFYQMFPWGEISI